MHAINTVMTTHGDVAAEDEPITRLLFLYGAESGKLAAVADSFKKLFGAGCPLCAVTHGFVGPRRSFLDLQERLSIPVVSVHSDELSQFEITESTPRPCILAEKSDGERVVLIDPAGIGRLKGTPRDLRGRLEFHAAKLGLALPTSGGA